MGFSLERGNKRDFMGGLAAGWERIMNHQVGAHRTCTERDYWKGGASRGQVKT